jgi:hypothetical protein
LRTATIHRHDPSTSKQIKSGEVDAAQKASVAVKWLQQAFQIVENAASSVDHSQEETGDAVLKSNPVNLQIKVGVLSPALVSKLSQNFPANNPAEPR